MSSKPLSLSPEQKAAVTRYIDPYREWLQTDEAANWRTQQDERVNNYSRVLKKDEIPKLTEPDIANLLSGLWANRFWTSKDYLLKQFFGKNPIESFKTELKSLLWDEAPLSQRYDRFRERIKHMGPAAITEILAFVHPDRCGIWNERVKGAFHVLGIDRLLPPKNKMTGEMYQSINTVIALMRDALNTSGLHSQNMLRTDLFMHFVDSRSDETIQEQTDEDYDFDHEEIIDNLLDIAGGLGFEAQSEVTIGKGARIDALWSARIGNLGIIKYAFEVQKGGSIDSLILNLQRAKNDPAVQKLVVVSNTKTLTKIKQEVSDLSADFTKFLEYMEARDIMKAASLSLELNDLLSRLQLIKRQT